MVDGGMDKLTLSMKKSVIRQARRVAQEHGTSISGFFSRVIGAMGGNGKPSKNGKHVEDELPPLTRKMLGMVQLPSDKSDRELIEDALEERSGPDK